MAENRDVAQQCRPGTDVNRTIEVAERTDFDVLSELDIGTYDRGAMDSCRGHQPVAGAKTTASVDDLALWSVRDWEIVVGMDVGIFLEGFTGDSIALTGPCP
jgi:hypothetical protein